MNDFLYLIIIYFRCPTSFTFPFTNHTADALVEILNNGELRRHEVDQLLTSISTSTKASTIQDILASLDNRCQQVLVLSVLI